ncbi:MAG TPA: hypothetical protein VJA20_02525 [Candidatus Nanoarchaeia archaeon]|nr:hypothetical protein [Candidatus Nanoarchaeia archaeon]
MKNLERIGNIIAYPFTGLGIGLTLLYLLPAILPSFDTGTKINGDKMKITKRKGAFSTVSFIKDKYKNKISIYNFNGFSKGYGLINLRDDNKDTLVDEVYFSNDPLTGSSLTIKRDTSKYAENDFIFKEADKIYKEEIEKFKE